LTGNDGSNLGSYRCFSTEPAICEKVTIRTGTVLGNYSINKFRLDGVHNKIGCPGNVVTIRQDSDPREALEGDVAALE
jgi:hypothetical protein